MDKGRDTLTPLPFVVISLWASRGSDFPERWQIVTMAQGLNVLHVLAKEICFILCKHKVRSMFTPDLMCTKYEADLLCQNITYITTKGRGVRVSHPVWRE